MQTIDVTPTWADVAPILIAAARNGSAAGLAELDRMLALAGFHMTAKTAVRRCSEATLMAIAADADAANRGA
jgi:hypothetical protein